MISEIHTPTLRKPLRRVTNGSCQAGISASSVTSVAPVSCGNTHNTIFLQKVPEFKLQDQVYSLAQGSAGCKQTAAVH